MRLPVAILAGGLATRLRPDSAGTPKALLPVAGRPFIHWQLELLARQGVTEAVLCVGFLGEQIEAAVGTGASFDLHVRYSYDGRLPLLTGGALRRALPMLGAEFFVLYGDSYLRCSFAAVQHAYEASERPALMTVFRNDNRWDRSNAALEGGLVVAYDKRCPTAQMGYVDYGLGVLSARTLADRPDGAAFDLGDVYHDLASRGELAGWEADERFYEIGSFAGRDATERYLSTGAWR